MAGIFEQLVINLNNMGFYGFVLPFLLVFALVYGLIIRSKIFGEPEKGAKGPAGVVSLAMAFFITAYSGIGQYFVAISGVGGMVLGALLVVVLFFALLGFEPSSGADMFKKSWFIGTLAVLGLIVFLVFQGATFAAIQLSSEAMAAIFVVIVIVLAMWFVTRDEK